MSRRDPHALSIVPLAGFLLTMASGCLSIEAPASFLVLDGSSSSEVRAITSDEAKLHVRELEDADEGELSFWVDAFRTECVDNRGYTLVEEEAITDASGRPGHIFIFEAFVGGANHRYLTAIFVREKLFSQVVRVAEFGARDEIFDAHVGEVRSAVRTIRP